MDKYGMSWDPCAKFCIVGCKKLVVEWVLTLKQLFGPEVKCVALFIERLRGKRIQSSSLRLYYSVIIAM